MFKAMVHNIKPMSAFYNKDFCNAPISIVKFKIIDTNTTLHTHTHIFFNYNTQKTK